MTSSNWPHSVQGLSLGPHLRKVDLLVGLAQRSTRESMWYAVYNHVLMFMAARNETDADPLYVWPQSSLFAKPLLPEEELQPSLAGKRLHMSQALAQD